MILILSYRIFTCESNFVSGQGPSAKDLNAELTKGNLDIIDTFTIKEENEFIVIDRKKKGGISSEQAKDASQPILGGNATQMFDHSKSSSESLNIAGEEKAHADDKLNVNHTQGKRDSVLSDPFSEESINCKSSSKESLNLNDTTPCKNALKLKEAIIPNVELASTADAKPSLSTSNQPSPSNPEVATQESHGESRISSTKVVSSIESTDSAVSGKSSDAYQVTSSQQSDIESVVDSCEASSTKESIDSNDADAADKQSETNQGISNQQSLDESMAAASEVESSKESLDSNGLGSSAESTETSSKESLGEASNDSLSETDIASSKDSSASNNPATIKRSRDDTSPGLGSESAKEGDKNEEELAERMKEDQQIAEHIRLITETMSKKLEIKDPGAEKREEKVDESSDDVEMEEEENEVNRDSIFG